MALAGSASEPLLGTATRSTFGPSVLGRVTRVGTADRSQVSVDVVEGQPTGQQHHLQVVEQLGNLLCQPGVALVLGRHPDLGRLLDDLLADGVDAGVQLGHRAGARGPGLRLSGELREQRVERLHGADDPTVAATADATTGPWSLRRRG